MRNKKKENNNNKEILPRYKSACDGTNEKRGLNEIKNFPFCVHLYNTTYSTFFFIFSYKNA